MGAEARQGVIGADVLYQYGSRRERRQQKPLPEVLAPLQPLVVCRLPHCSLLLLIFSFRLRLSLPGNLVFFVFPAITI